MHYLSKSTGHFILSAILFASCGDNKTAKEADLFYPTVEVEKRNIQSFRTYPAAVQGVNNNEVRAKIPGYVQQVLVDEGQYVKKGELLFRLETDALSQEESAARAGISASRAKVEVARVEVDKLRPLVDQHIVSPVLLETARANLLQAESELEQAEANHKSIAANVDYSAIRSPISGVVGKINLREGSLASPGDGVPITTISDVDELYAYFSMNEAEYLDFLEETPGNSLGERLKNTPLVELELANGKTYSEKGKISAITGQIDPQTGSVSFRASFPNKNRTLAHGSSGKIRLPKTHQNAAVIPETAIFERQGKFYAGKVDNNTVEIVEIQTVDRIDNLVLVKNGLQPGNRVVTSGVGALQTGAIINVAN